MRMQDCVAVLCALSVFSMIGCDSSSSVTNGGDDPFRPPVPGPPPIGNPGPNPVLLDMEISGEGICVGDEIILTGRDFSNLLTENEVLFVAGATQIEGLPLRVDFPSDGNSSNGLESRLVVLVPTGVATGNLELRVAGIPAGAPP